MTTFAARPAPHPDAPGPGTLLPQHDTGCFGCGDQDSGLRLRFLVGEDLTVTSTFTVGRHHQGAPGLCHGGVLAAVFDEALGTLQTLFGQPAVTASLATEFRRPVPVGAELHLHCRVDGREGRKLRVSGEARLDTADGPVAARARALFVFVDPRHFTRHRR